MPLLALCLGYFMTILDVTIVNVALADIKEHLGANVAGLQWIVDGYALVFASFLLTGGALGDKRGSRTIFLAGFALFTLASTLCSLAPTLLVLPTDCATRLTLAKPTGCATRLCNSWNSKTAAIPAAVLN